MAGCVQRLGYFRIRGGAAGFGRCLGAAACDCSLRDVEAIRAHVFAAERIHADDTTVPILAKGKTRAGRLKDAADAGIQIQAWRAGKALQNNGKAVEGEGKLFST